MYDYQCFIASQTLLIIIVFSIQDSKHLFQINHLQTLFDCQGHWVNDMKLVVREGNSTVILLNVLYV